MTKFKRMQESDSSLQTMWSKAKQNDSRYCISNELYERSSKVDDSELLLLSEKLRDELLYLAHDCLISGNMTISKTISRIWQHFSLPGLELAVRKYVLSCPQCRRVARVNLKDRAPLVSIPIVSERMQEWLMDFADPYHPSSSSRKKYNLILVDVATKWPVAVTMTSQRADKLVNEMIKLFSRLGLPRVVRSDLGASFKSELLTKFESELGVKPCFSTAYHYQSLSSAERYIGTLFAQLSC